MPKNIICKIGMVQSNTIASNIFVSLIDHDFRQVTYATPHEYVKLYMDAYRASKVKKNASLNGNFFEIVIKTLLYREGILPYYSQAKAAFVPNIIYDVLLYSKSEPVSLSLKTSLRERYKQADLEAVALKYVHRKSKSFILTIEKNEADGAKEKVKSGNILGLDGIIYCLSEELDTLIGNLKKKTFAESEKIEVIEGALVRSIDLV